MNVTLEILTQNMMKCVVKSYTKVKATLKNYIYM